jgi:hypothetical protein
MTSKGRPSFVLRASARQVERPQWYVPISQKSPPSATSWVHGGGPFASVRLGEVDAETSVVVDVVVVGRPIAVDEGG